MTRRFTIAAQAGLVLAAGAALALSGSAGHVLTLTGVDTPVQAASAPCRLVRTPGTTVAVGAVSPPAGCTVVSAGPGATIARQPAGAEGLPAQAYSAPACVEARTAGAAVTVGAASPPARCTEVTAGGLPVEAYSAPVGAASAPRCVQAVTPNAAVRRGC